MEVQSLELATNGFVLAKSGMARGGLLVVEKVANEAFRKSGGGRVLGVEMIRRNLYER